MVATSTWIRYFKTKLDYSISLVGKSFERGEISRGQVGDTFFKNFLHGKMTFLHLNKGEEMAPTIAAQGGTLLVRKMPYVEPLDVFVGDVVVLKDPEKPNNFLVRRLAALEGYKMVSSDDKEEPFVLQEDECWVVADNESLKPKEARDSRIFGPVPLSNIVGRVMYSLQTDAEHGPVQNSRSGMDRDYPVLVAELDVDEMTKNHER